MIFFYFIGNGILVKKQFVGITRRQGSMSLNNGLYLTQAYFVFLIFGQQNNTAPVLCN